MSDIARLVQHTIRHSQLRKAGGGAAFGTLSPGEEAETPPNILDKLVAGTISGMTSLPRRAIENSQQSLDTGDYDPTVPMEAAMLTLGTGAGARGGYRPVNPARAEIDQPPQLTYKPSDIGALDARPAERTAAAPAGDVGQGLGDTPGGGPGLREAQLSAERRASGRAGLEGLPTEEQLIDGQFYVPGPFGRAHDIAEQYMASRPTPSYHKPPERYHEIDKEHSAAIARAYEEMAHAPNDPAVQASYEALIKETLAQYQAIKASGLKITPVGGAEYPYGRNPRAVARDVTDNNHMAFFKTDEGFGTSDAIHAENPMLRSSGEKIGDHDMLNNDIFRVVHDYFGHIKNGYGFRATGEDNAWRAHAAMYSDLARPAMTTETRGQNSWVNYGPHGEKNRTASGADTVYADQKVGLMPEWTMRDRGSPEPIIAYHGSPYSFDKFDPTKIGAGEGNQAYGHGLYFAEHSPVSEFYRYQLSTRRDPLLKKYGLDTEQGAHLGIQLASSKGDPAPVIASLQEGLDKLLAERAGGRADKATQNMIKAREGKIAYLQDKERATGHMYQVAIDAPPEKFINWEERLNRQTPEVQEGVKKAMGVDYYNKHDQAKADRMWESFKDANASNALRQGFIASSDELVARRLHDAGIPGIRYRDQGSRRPGVVELPNGKFYADHPGSNVSTLRKGTFDTRQEAEAAIDKFWPPQTNNYVTFDAPRMLKRYAKGGAIRRAAEGGAFGTMSPAEESERPPSIIDKIFSGAMSGLSSLPRRVIENSQRSLDTGDYDPGPVLEAATLPLGTGAVAGVPVKGAEVALGSGALRMKPPARAHFEGELKDVNAGVHSRPDTSIQTVADPYRMMYPGIYRNPKLIAEEAAARVGAEDPAMKQLFDVTRGDLREMAQGRVGNEEPNLRLAQNPRGSLAAQNIQTPHNTQRLVDTLIEAGKHEGLRTADAWYIMDPMYQRMKELYGPEQAAIRFRHLNTTTGMASPGSDVLTEIQRGTGAHWLQEQGRFDDFVKYGGLTGPARQSPKVPRDVRYIGGHPYHRTSQTEPMQKYFDTGAIQSEKAKVPLYVHASGVPETGFQTSGPVGDAHFSRGVGLSDTRKGPSNVEGSFSKPEYQTLQPWWKDEVAGPAGLESVPAQARLWTTLGPQTGVESELGAPKLELFSKQIMKAARRLGVSPEKARDMILSGKAGAGARGGVASSFAPGGRVGYEDGGMTDDGAPVFDPAKLAAVKPAATPVFDPAKLASTKPREAAPMDAMDVVSGAVENAPASAWQFAKDVVRPVTHPVETLAGIKDLGLGLLEKSGAIGTIFPSAGGGHEQYADAMGQYLKNRYGGLENIKKTIAKDPVGALSDASMVLTGGGSAAARLPGALGRAGEITGAVGRAVDPILAPVNAARAGTKAVGELMTHTGATPLENAYRTGVEGGEAGEVFRGQMRGTSEMTEPVQMAREGLEGFRKSRAKNYNAGRDEITSLDRQMAPQDRILDFGKIDDAVDRARKVQTFGTRVLDKGANEVRNSMISEINEWKALDPIEYHTIDGMDALKRSLGHMMMDTQPGTSARKAAGDIYNAVKKTIVEYDPKYARVMKDYEQASTQVRELERAMSLGEKASADTALRKLQSIMRNNVNTNYGRRLELGKLLEENGATHLMAALSGQALNAWAPRGLGKLGAELAVIGGAGHFISPWTLAATPLMSPRLMGEVAHAAGRTAGRALEKTNKAFSSVGLGGNRTAGNVSYRLGRATNPDENETNPYAP